MLQIPLEIGSSHSSKFENLRIVWWFQVVAIVPGCQRILGGEVSRRVSMDGWNLKPISDGPCFCFRKNLYSVETFNSGYVFGCLSAFAAMHVILKKLAQENTFEVLKYWIFLTSQSQKVKNRLYIIRKLFHAGTIHGDLLYVGVYVNRWDVLEGFETKALQFHEK